VLTEEAFGPVGGACSWTELADEAIVRDMAGTFGESGYYHQTGRPPHGWPAACKLRQRIERKSVSDSIRHIVTVPDFAYAQLTGELYTDITSAQITGLADFQRRQWSDDILDWAGVREELVPAIRSDLSVLKEDLATRWGKVTLVSGSHDQYAAMAAAGLVKDTSVMLGTGTAWVINGRTSRPLFDDRRFEIHPGADLHPDCCGFIITLWQIGAGFDRLLSRLGVTHAALPGLENSLADANVPQACVKVDLGAGALEPAGYMKIILPAIVVLPGLILFARYPEVMKLPWDKIRPDADKGYVSMLQSIVPIGLRGLFLAALFGAIQSTVSAVLNSTSTILTVDIYKRMLHRSASERRLVLVGRVSSVIVMIVAAVLGGFIGRLGGSLFLYIQSLYAFFAPPFAAVFLLGILFRRINGQGATIAVALGFILGILLKLYVQFVPSHPGWLEPFQMQAAINWAFCVVVCVGVSLLTPRPDPSQVTDELTVNWKRLNIFHHLGATWYASVHLWWGLFVAIIAALILVFSGLVW